MRILSRADCNEKLRPTGRQLGQGQVGFGNKNRVNRVNPV